MCKISIISICVFTYITFIILFCYKPSELFEFCAGGNIINETDFIKNNCNSSGQINKNQSFTG